jgi:hypothetical protein
MQYKLLGTISVDFYVTGEILIVNLRKNGNSKGQYIGYVGRPERKNWLGVKIFERIFKKYILCIMCVYPH